jgi:hypothetical protein
VVKAAKASAATKRSGRATVGAARSGRR